MFETLPHLIDGLRDAPPDHGVAFGEGETISWRRLHAHVLERAAAARRLGVEAGQRVALTATNDATSLESLLALLWLGAVPLSLPAAPFGQDPAARAAYLADVVGETRARWVLGEASAGAAALALPRESTATPPPRATPAPDATALVQFSSGSTTRPKGIRLTHDNVRTNVALVSEAGGRRSDESLVTWVPMSHDMGLVGTWLTTLAVRPRRLRMMQPMRFLMRPLTWLEHLSRDQARVSTCPSFALDRCVERFDARFLAEREVDLSGLEALLVGAETVRPRALARFADTFAPWGLDRRALVPVYGLAEATLIVTAHPLGGPVRTRRIGHAEVVSVGRPLGDFEVRIRDGGGRAPTGAVGEIQIRGRSVTPGLLEPGTDELIFEDGWLRTGDLGAVDEEGRLYVTGRRKDLLLVAGRNYYAHDIGAALEGVPDIHPDRTHAFTALVDERKRVVVLAVRRGAASGSDEEASDAVRRRVLARCGLAVDDVLFVRRIPRNSSGKIERHACEALYRERVLT